MTQIKLKYVEKYHDRHGRLRCYFRRMNFDRYPLHGTPGSAEFMADYAVAWAATEQPNSPLRRAPGAARTKPGSIGALVVAYLNSAAYAGLAPSTRKTYYNILDALRVEYGEDAVAGLRAKHVRALIEKKAASGSPHAANNLLKLLRILMRHAVDFQLIENDPTVGVHGIRVKSKGHHSWSDDEIHAFEGRWPVGTRARLAFALLLYTGQRRSDVIGMGRQHVRAGAIDVTQQKTGTTLSIALHPALREILDASPRKNLTFLTTASGKPFSAAGFGNWFRECCTSAGLPHCSAHGLRHAAARRLAEAGCTAHQIAAVTGHKTLKDVERYTRAAEQKRLAGAAIAALPGAEIGTPSEQNCLTSDLGAAKV